MTIWKPDTCHCIVDVENQTLIKPCKNHTKYLDVLYENQAENLKHGINPSESQLKSITESKRKLKYER